MCQISRTPLTIFLFVYVRNPSLIRQCVLKRTTATFLCVQYIHRIPAACYTPLPKCTFLLHVHAWHIMYLRISLRTLYTRYNRIHRVCLRIYACAQVICTRTAFAIYVHTEIRVYAAFIHVHSTWAVHV